LGTLLFNIHIDDIQSFSKNCNKTSFQLSTFRHTGRAKLTFETPFVLAFKVKWILPFNAFDETLQLLYETFFLKSFRDI